MASRFDVARSPDGRWWLLDNETRTRYEATGPGQITGIQRLYGTGNPDSRGYLATGYGPSDWKQGPAVVTLFGGPGGIEQVLAGQKPNPIDPWYGKPPPLTPGATPPPSGTPIDPRARNFTQEAKRLLPWMPDELIGVYATAWQETGDPSQATAIMRSNQAYERYFPGNKKPNGMLAMSEMDYVSYVDRSRQMMRAAGLPPGFYDEPQDFANFIQNNLSLNEVEQRVNEGYLAAMQAPAEFRTALRDYYGIDTGQLAAFWLDPDRATAVIEREYLAAQLGGTARMTGFGTLNKDQAQRLAQLGIDPNAGAQGFVQLAQQREIMNASIGEETGLTMDQQLSGAFEGNADLRNRMARRESGRRSAFEGGGGAAVGESGLIGLRSGG